MRKKFFAMYALVGALVASPVFTSCIDDTESASVTAVRTQKAEAMRIANQIAAANAELQIQRDKLALEKDIANYEQNIAYYEALLLQYQLEIKENQKELDNFGVKTLSDLTNTYTTALSNVATTEWNIVKYNQQIEQIKAGHANALEELKEDIAEYNEDIAEYQAKIEKLKKLQEEGVDATALEATKKELKAIQDKANKDYKDLQLQYGIAANYVQNNYNNSIDYAKGLDVIKAMDFFKDPDGNGVNYNDGHGNNNAKYVTMQTAEGLYILKEAAVLQAQRDYANNLVTEQEALDLAIAKLGKETDKVDAVYEDNSVEYSTVYAQLAISNEYLKKLEKDLAKAEKDLADNTDASLKPSLEQAVEDAEDAIELFNKNNTNNAGSLTVGEDAAAVTYTVWGPLYVEMEILEAKDDIKTAEKNLELAKAESKGFEEALKAFEGEAYEAYKTAVAELNAAKDSYLTAKAEYEAVVALYDNIETTNSGVSGKTFDEAIALYEAEIERINAEIKELGASFPTFSEMIQYSDAMGTWWTSNNVTLDSEEVLAGTVAYLEKKIAIEETKLAAYNKMAEEAKAALDAYLATEEA